MLPFCPVLGVILNDAKLKIAMIAIHCGNFRMTGLQSAHTELEQDEEIVSPSMYSCNNKGL